MNLYWFLNSEDKSLMNVVIAIFHAVKGLPYWRIGIYARDIYKIPSRPPLFHIGLLAELLISTGPHSPAHFVLRELPAIL
jgi:hypothetical protein